MNTDAIILTYSEARKDEEAMAFLEKMLKSENLCNDDLDKFPGFLQLVQAPTGDLVGGYGIEVYDKEGLLRSVVIESNFRKSGIGSTIVIAAIARARALDLEYLYLLTTTAESFFKKMGFQVIARNSVPESIANTREFKTFCPDTAICMKYEI